MIPDHVTTQVRGYLTFKKMPVPEGRKTAVWKVENSKSIILGQISWFGPWRRFALFPNSGMVLDSSCLQTITDFIKELQKARRRTKNATC